MIHADPFTRKRVTRECERSGHYHLETVEHATEGLKLLAEAARPWDLVLVEVPREGGPDVVEALTACRCVAALVFSGHEPNLTAQLTRATERGLRVVGALVEPIRKEVLARILSELGNKPAHVERPHTDEGVRASIRAGHIVNAYVPRVGLRTGQVLAVEAIPRWRSSRGGISADPLDLPAGSPELAHDLARVVLLDALRHRRRWADAGLPLDVTLAVPTDSPVDPSFPTFVTTAAALAGVPLARITLHLGAGPQLPRTLASLAWLRVRGVSLSIHDGPFAEAALGPPLASALDELKLDRAQIETCDHDAAARTRFAERRARTREAGILLGVVGVETTADWAFV